jgi:hypothetical protein
MSLECPYFLPRFGIQELKGIIETPGENISARRGKDYGPDFV